MSSILLERRGAFIAGDGELGDPFRPHGSRLFRRIFQRRPRPGATCHRLQYIISLNIFGFCSVAFLSNYLAESLRRTGVELERSTGTGHISPGVQRPHRGQSWVAVSITTDLEGRIYLFNRAAEESHWPATRRSAAPDDLAGLSREWFEEWKLRVSSCRRHGMTERNMISAVFGFSRHDRRKEHGRLCLVI